MPLHKGTTGFFGRLLPVTYDKRPNKIICHQPCSILGPPLRLAIFLAPSSMISLPHLFSISNANVRFLISVKSLIFPPIYIKASLGVLEDRGVIAWRVESVDYYVVFLSLRRFDTVERMLSYKLLQLIMWYYLVT